MNKMLYFFKTDGLTTFVQLPKYRGGVTEIDVNKQALCSKSCEGCPFHEKECECSLAEPFSKHLKSLVESQEIKIHWQMFYNKEMQRKSPENRRNN